MTAFLSTLSLRRATMVLRAVSNSLVIFLSTLSLRRATIISQTIFIWVNNFYPRSPYGERPCPEAPVLDALSISIHALLTESDAVIGVVVVYQLVFLSTLSLRRATCWVRSRLRRSSNFYPRSPYGERPLHRRVIGPDRKFLSTLSLRRATNQSGHCER